jgi:hypothetical protein
MNSKRFLSVRFSVFLLCLTLWSPGQAVPLPPTGFVALRGTSVAERPELAGVVVADVVNPWGFPFPGPRLGTLEARVVREVSGTLDFYYRITSDATTLGAVALLEILGFDNLAVDVDFRTDSLGSKALESARSDTIPPDGTPAIAFQDPSGITGIGPGEESLFMFIRTGARAFGPSEALIEVVDIDSSLTDLVPSFAPVVAVSEPAGGSLVVLGLVLLGCMPRTSVGAKHHPK